VEYADKKVAIPGDRITVLDGVTFADSPNTLFAPVYALGKALNKPIRKVGKSTLYWDTDPLSRTSLRFLADGTPLVTLQGMPKSEEITIAWEETNHAARIVIRKEGRSVWVRLGEKRVAISIGSQRMRAWQGPYLVLDTHVSTGRLHKPTPRGHFMAGPIKSPLLLSKKYNNARMPWSVQIRGEVFIHGFGSVPRRAASHGCVRVPLTGHNPALWFYRWVEIGTPIDIQNGWPEIAP
jgi:lipoprotein-anchoring transpeptidase ErfK/SrfK